MDLTRRQFLKISGGGATGLALVGLGVKPKIGGGQLPKGKVLRGKQTPTICPYDASGCGFIVTTEGGKLVNIEGDPDHPISGGCACAKGASLAQLHNNDRRLSKVLYRCPGGTAWEEKNWDWAVEEIAKRIKAARDANWIARDDQGFLVNRTEAIASVGGSALDNEDCYLLVKFLRSLGSVYVENQARI